MNKFNQPHLYKNKSQSLWNLNKIMKFYSVRSTFVDFYINSLKMLLLPKYFKQKLEIECYF